MPTPITRAVAAASGFGFLNTVVATDPYYSFRKLGLHFDGANGGTTFTDNSPVGNNSPTVSGVTTSTTQVKFGTASGSFPSTNYLDYGSGANYNPAAGDFAFAMFVYASTDSPFCGNDNYGVAGNFQLYLNGSTLTFGDYLSTINLTSASFPMGAWTHVAVSRVGNVWSLYKNGTRVSTQTTAFTLTAGNFKVGYAPSYGLFKATYIDDFLFYKGSAAIYTGASFTVPTAPFPNS